MRPLVLLAAFALPLAGLLHTTTGCGDACADLQAICDDCTDADYRESCQRDVDNNVQSVCSQRADSYRTACPVPTDTSSTTTSTGATTGSGGAGGSGGSSTSTSSTTGAGGSTGGAGGSTGGAGGSGGSTGGAGGS